MESQNVAPDPAPADTAQESSSTDTPPPPPSPESEPPPSATAGATWHPSYSDAQAAGAGDKAQDGDTSDTDGATDAPPDTAEHEAATKAAAEMIGAGVAMWVNYSYQMCGALGHPWPVPPWPHPSKRDKDGQPLLLEPGDVVAALAGFAGESAERVAIKYGFRIPLQDELVTGIAITVPALVLRAAMKNPQNADAPAPEQEKVDAPPDGEDHAPPPAPPPPPPAPTTGAPSARSAPTKSVW